MKQKGFSSVFAIIVIAAVIVGAAFYFQQTSSQNKGGRYPQEVQNIDIIQKMLTDGQWEKNLGLESYRYRFSVDHDNSKSYSEKFVTDYNTSPTGGSWDLSQDTDGKAILALTPHGDGAKCYWLPCASFISYNPVSDSMLVRGENIDGVQKLIHMK